MVEWKNEKRMKNFVLLVGTIFILECVASFYTYGNIWHLDSFDWVWHISFVIYGTIFLFGLPILAVIKVQNKYQSLFFSEALIIDAFVLYHGVWPSFVWIEEQVLAVIPNVRIAWTLVLGAYVVALYLCHCWLE